MVRNEETAGARGAYAPLLAQLFQLYPSVMRRRPTLRLGYRQVGHLAHGWYLRCHRGVEAILTLDRAGYAEEAAPIRRSVIEHVLALRWLAVEGDAILDTVARAHEYRAKAIAGAVSAAGWTSIALADIEKVIAGIDAENRDRSNDHLIHFVQRLSDYGDEHSMPGYLAECARTHPGYESAVCYVELPSGAPLSESRDALWQVPFSTTHMLEALLALRQAFDPEPWKPELDVFVDSYLAITDEVRRQDGLPPVDWSTGKLSPAPE